MQSEAQDLIAAEPADKPQRLPLVLWALFAYLAAIIIFGKGPTYLGVGPLYWGELTMCLLLGWMFVRFCLRGTPPWAFSVLVLPVLSFMLLGAVLTVASIGHWPLADVLRDSAVWYYAAFCFIGLYMASVPAYADRLWKLLVWVWFAAVAWNILNRLTGGWLVSISPAVPGRGVPVLGGSGSENYMHLALGAILLVLGFAWKRESLVKKLAIIAVVLASAGLLFTCNGRGIKVAVVGALVVGILATFRARKTIWPTGKTFAVVFILVWLLGVGAILSGPEGLSKAGRLYRFEEISEQATSGTAYWRRVWWDRITAEVHQENPALGLGFGINLGKLNPFLTGDEKSAWPVRSPHNYNITVFGRMGYLGLAAWIVVLVVGLGGLFVRVARGRLGSSAYTVERRKELAFWLMVLTACWLNASFGVLMEGPVLGILFWFALGFATGRSKDPDGLEPAEESPTDELLTARYPEQPALAPPEQEPSP